MCRLPPGAWLAALCAVSFQPTGWAALAVPKSLRNDYSCAVRCAGLTARERKAVEALYDQAGCGSAAEGSWPSPVCSTSVEQLCAGSCGGGKVNMASWLPDTFGPNVRVPLDTEQKAKLRQAWEAHQHCAARCADEGISVPIEGPLETVTRTAVETLQRCGVVQLPGATEAEPLRRVEKAFAALRSRKKAYKALLDQEQLHDGRYQLYLPFAEPFTSARALGANDLVLSVLEAYFGSTDFGIDHVSILTAGSPSGNQSLHPDVPYFTNLAVSVHTALQDISFDMGPTYFCPCTGENLVREKWPASAAIKMAVLKRKECLGRSHSPKHTLRGTVTIYDGAMFHKGLGNDSGHDRHILKLEIGASDFPIRRNYIGAAPQAAQKQAAKFRQVFGPPRMGTLKSADSAKSDL